MGILVSSLRHNNSYLHRQEGGAIDAVLCCSYNGYYDVAVEISVLRPIPSLPMEPALRTCSLTYSKVNHNHLFFYIATCQGF